MLVLSRKLNQSIVLGDNVKIEILKISGNTVRIGIQAPADVKILRGELAPYEVDTNAENQLANAINSPSRSNNRNAQTIPQTSTMELEFEIGGDQEDLSQLPNPFAIAHAG
jgi:carbon storage regulator CsrA